MSMTPTELAEQEARKIVEKLFSSLESNEEAIDLITAALLPKYELIEACEPIDATVEARKANTIVVCGSLKFIKMMEGFALLRPDTYILPVPGRVKHFAQEDHRRKIEQADKVLVFNFGGYIGEDTAAEIKWAKLYSKPIDYLEPISKAEKVKVLTCWSDETILAVRNRQYERLKNQIESIGRRYQELFDAMSVYIPKKGGDGI